MCSEEGSYGQYSLGMGEVIDRSVLMYLPQPSTLVF